MAAKSGTSEDFPYRRQQGTAPVWSGLAERTKKLVHPGGKEMPPA
jgi:hypothetical protein